MHSRRTARIAPLAVVALLVAAGVTATALGKGGDRVMRGSHSVDVIRGGGTAERIFGFRGNDQLFGHGGADVIVAGAGRDLVVAGPGNDRIDVRDGRRDIVFCGPGADLVSRDRIDVLKRDCERRGAKPKQITSNRSAKPVAQPVRHKPPATPKPGAGRPYPLMVSVVGSGRIKSTPVGIDCPSQCRANFGAGTVVTLTATAGSGATLASWGGKCRGAKTPCTFVVRSKSWIRANFSGVGGGGTPPPPAPPPPPGPPPPPPPPSSGRVAIRDNEPFRCNGPVNLDLVRVTIRTTVADALSLDQNCTGRIGRIEIDTWTADGIKVQNRGTVAHDLVIESGYVKCHDVAGDYHQDGVQAMGGYRLTFRNLAIDCLRNSNFFLARGGSGASTPTDVVCEGCILGPNSAQTIFYATSLRSGAVGTTVCHGRYQAVRVHSDAVDRVDRGNVVLPRGHASCANVTGR